MTTIEIDTPDGPIDALLSIPPGNGPWPGVVVIHDAFGYRPDKESTNDHIARAGLFGVDSEFVRAGWPGPLHHASHA